MDNANSKINIELIKNLQQFFDSGLDEQIELNQKTKTQMFGQASSDRSEKEIVVNIKASIYEKNEKGETVAPSQVFENNFYIPIDKEQDSEEALKLFTDKLNNSLLAGVEEVFKNE